MSTARDELLAGGPCRYVILRADEGAESSANRAHRLRQIIEAQGSVSRTPTAGEREALEAGLGTLGIPRAPYG